MEEREASGSEDTSETKDKLTSNSATDGEERRCLIVGLGNPGESYERTRHNYGFLVIDELARRRGISASGLCSSEHFCVPFGGGEEGNVELHMAKPQTFMNRSGLAVRCLAQRFGFSPENVLVVFDDVSLRLGRQRLRSGGSAGGHRGLESVLENLRTDSVPRLRLGISREFASPRSGPDPDLTSFVLEPFGEDEHETVNASIRWAADACESWLRYGIDRTMNQFNGSLVTDSN